MGLAAAALLLAANVVVPIGFGDLYPFTSAPMFRDRPRQYCVYRVFGADGGELPAEAWLLQRVYDGNPVGYGVGVRPPAVLEREFGIVHDEAEVRRHVARQFEQPQHRSRDIVEVVQEVIGPVDSQHVGVVHVNRWRVGSPK
jgi:hypothetical protein